MSEAMQHLSKTLDALCPRIKDAYRTRQEVRIEASAVGGFSGRTVALLLAMSDEDPRREDPFLYVPSDDMLELALARLT